MFFYEESHRFETALGRVKDYRVLIIGRTKALMIIKQASFSMSINIYCVERYKIKPHVLARYLSDLGYSLT